MMLMPAHIIATKDGHVEEVIDQIFRQSNIYPIDNNWDFDVDVESRFNVFVASYSRCVKFALRLCVLYSLRFS